MAQPAELRGVSVALLAFSLAFVLGLPSPSNAGGTRRPEGTAKKIPRGSVTFFPNQILPCDTDIAGSFGCGQLVEAEVSSASDGTIYVTAQEGVPAGVDFWRRDPGSFEYVQLPKPDGQPVLTETTGLAYGGGDNDLAVSTDGKVYVSSLALVTAGVATSTDRGDTFAYNAAASGLVGVDRQWMTTFGPSTVYMSYHDFYVFNIWLVKSTDAGATFGPPISMIPPQMLPQFMHVVFTPFGGNVTSDLVADPDERVALVFIGSADPVENNTSEKPTDVFISITEPGGANPQVHLVHEGDENLMGLFPALAVDQGGNLYASWTNLHGVFVSISRDHGVTWSEPLLVSSGKGSTTTVFPFAIGGSAGRIGFAWLGTAAETQDDEDAQWRAYYSWSLNALAKKPRWQQVEASDHIVHEGSICLEGLACDIALPLPGFGGNRNLAEVLQMGLTPDGRVLIAYPDDSQTAFGWSFIAEQQRGPGLFAGVKTAPPTLEGRPRNG
jgi:hypothetical protein